MAEVNSDPSGTESTMPSLKTGAAVFLIFIFYIND